MHAVYHSESRAQNGYDRDAFVGNLVLRGGFEWRVHLYGNEFYVPHAFVGHHRRDFFYEFAEFFHARFFVAQDRNFVFDKRMVENKYVRIVFHVTLPP